MNTVVFLLSTTQQACTFLVNYTGAPFMQPLFSNRQLLVAVAATYAFALLGASGFSTDMNEYLEFVPLPTTPDTAGGWGLQAGVMGLILLDLAGCVGLEVTLRTLFGMGERA